jgi:hypothetical protein
VSGEQIYDEQIAPLLLQACKLCEAHGMAMVATVEYELEKIGRTFVMPDSAGLAMLMQHLVSRSGVNVDGYIINLLRLSQERGIDTSGSIVLSRWGK